MPSSNSHITEDNLEAIIADRTRIINHFIDQLGVFSSYEGRHQVEALAKCVFFESGWDYRVEPVVAKKAHFFVRTFDREA